MPMEIIRLAFGFSKLKMKGPGEVLSGSRCICSLERPNANLMIYWALALKSPMSTLWSIGCSIALSDSDVWGGSVTALAGRKPASPYK